jgi:hypothetical protein
MSGETLPVAWRVKDSSGGWMICSETAAKLLIERNSALIEPLYSADALASRDAEIERLKGERDDLRWAIMGGEDAPGLLDTVPHEEVLRALQESRSNWKAYWEKCNFALGMSATLRLYLMLLFTRTKIADAE